ncbi:LAQU0S02e07382g1_1 [Lachancea quebecensis]|uniref:LAQU0S02e07382g1_1 n=1 Tax=Lachancea quebecensis TaxID=1654605 RepID=A0A0P1KQT6_9SACH|nr:LAQU0S02e07382g1_1 [Lachancea quebecensis]
MVAAEMEVQGRKHSEPVNDPMAVGVASRVEIAARRLHSYPSSAIEALDAAYEFANAVRHLKPHQEPQVADLDVFTPLVQLCLSERDSRDSVLDLLATTFAYCSVHQTLAKLVRAFVRRSLHNQPVASQLRELCGSFTTNYNPGFYSVISKLECYTCLDTSVFKALKLNLGPTLRMIWIPLWTQEVGIDLYSAVLSHNLLVSAGAESKLDFLIATWAHATNEWAGLKDRGSEALKSLIYQTARRAILFDKWIPDRFFKFCQQAMSEWIESDCFLKIETDISFNLSILMEVLDHPGLNFLEEPHLALLLRLALRRIWNMCSDDQIRALHLELGKMGSTQSLLGLLNITQYLLARFLLRVGSLVMSAQNYNSNKEWMLQDTPYQLPGFFDNIVPAIPPVPRSTFSFVNNKIESELLANRHIEIISSLLDSLKCLLSINKMILRYYKANEVQVLALRSTSSQKDTTIDNRSTLEILQLYFISMTSALLLSRQLAEEQYLTITEGQHEYTIQGRLIETEALACYESIISMFKSTSLLQLVKFSDRISMAELSLQKASMQILNFVFFEASFSVTQAPSLTNKLTVQALYEYINLWNDGSSAFRQFYTEIFKIPQPLVKRVQVDLEKFLCSLTFEIRKDSSTPTPIASRGAEPKNNGYVPKYNAHASSFVPASKAGGKHSIDNEKPFGMPASNQLTPLSADFPQQLGICHERTEDAGNAFAAQRYSGSADSMTPSSAQAPSPFSVRRWDSNCFSQGLNNSPEASSAVVSTGKDYILGGHNKATNNSRAQSVHVDRFDYVRQ